MTEWCCSFYQTDNMFMIVTVDWSEIRVKRVEVASFSRYRKHGKITEIE